MRLAPRAIDKLVLHNAGFLAQKRLARGLRLNYPEAVALIATQLLELIRDGRYQSLVFRYWLHNGFDEKEIDDSLPPILLLEGIRDGEFHFKGLDPEGKVGDWKGDWEDPQLTPLSIQLELEMSAESRMEWPLLEIVMMVDGGATRGFNPGLTPAGG